MVDLQGDFTEWKQGSLAVPGTTKQYVNEVVKETQKYKGQGYKIMATQDWHPLNHISFVQNHKGKEVFDRVVIGQNRKQVLWPVHCVQNSVGAEILLPPTLIDEVVRKGADESFDSYSGFKDDGGQNTELNSIFKDLCIENLVIYGLATDYCVKATVLDAISLGYNVRLVPELCRGVDKKSTTQTLKAFQKLF